MVRGIRTTPSEERGFLAAETKPVQSRILSAAPQDRRSREEKGDPHLTVARAAARRGGCSFLARAPTRRSTPTPPGHLGPQGAAWRWQNCMKASSGSGDSAATTAADGGDSGGDDEAGGRMATGARVTRDGERRRESQPPHPPYIHQQPPHRARRAARLPSAQRRRRAYAARPQRRRRPSRGASPN